MRGEHPRVILQHLEQRARRRFGQHFLWQTDVVARIVRGARIEPGDRVLEVGPGLGILTHALVATGAEVTAIELDRDLAVFVREHFPEVRLVEGDAMAIDPATLFEGGGVRVVANLPYNVGTGLVLEWSKRRDVFQSLTVMLQKEVVDRMLAEPGTKAYGALTVQLAARARSRFVLLVPPGAFHPPPKVKSAVIRVELLPEPDYGPAGEAFFDRVVRAAFSQRRKTLANALTPQFGKEFAREALEAAGIDGGLRAERLDVHQYRALAAALAPRADLLVGQDPDSAGPDSSP